MQRQPTPKRTCLACRSGDYPFRSRSKAAEGQGRGGADEVLLQGLHTRVAGESAGVGTGGIGGSAPADECP